MWGFVISLIMAIIFVLTFHFQSRKIEELKNCHLQLKFNYENQILEILNDVKQLENRYATSGTEMCKFLEEKIAYHSRIFHKYKNELNIGSDDD